MHKYIQGERVTILASGQIAIVNGYHIKMNKERVECRWMDGDMEKKDHYSENELKTCNDIVNSEVVLHNFSLGEIVTIIPTGKFAIVFAYIELFGKVQVECIWWEGDIQYLAYYSESELMQANY